MLLLLAGNVSINPGLIMHGALNARFISNKGPLLADTTASLDFDVLCLNETRACSSDTDTFLCHITSPDFVFNQRLHPSGIGSDVLFFIICSFYNPKIDSPLYHSFKNMVVSVMLSWLYICLHLLLHPIPFMYHQFSRRIFGNSVLQWFTSNLTEHCQLMKNWFYFV